MKGLKGLIPGFVLVFAGTAGYHATVEDGNPDAAPESTDLVQFNQTAGGGNEFARLLDTDLVLPATIVSSQVSAQEHCLVLANYDSRSDPTFFNCVPVSNNTTSHKVSEFTGFGDDLNASFETQVALSEVKGFSE